LVTAIFTTVTVEDALPCVVVTVSESVPEVALPAWKKAFTCAPALYD
jgi:hypothetical protein